MVRGEGAIVRQRMPQLDVLRRARLMISHGGFNSIQECARNGVPMIVFPSASTSPAAPPASSITVSASAATSGGATAETIGRLIDDALEDEAMRQRCAAMAERSRDPSEGEAGMRVLEALAQRP